MKHTTLFCMLLSAILLLAFFTGCKQKQHGLAHLIFAQGDVTIIQNDVNKPVQPGTAVYPKDIIATGEKSFAVLQIADKAIAHINSNSRVAVAALMETSVALYLEKGEIISKVERLQKGQEYTIKTRSVVASVRGTQFLVQSGDALGKVAVQKGSVSVKPLVEEQGIQKEAVEETVVDEGKAAIVTVEEEAKKAEPIVITAISVKDTMKIKAVAGIGTIPEEEIVKPEALDKVQETIQQSVKEVEKIETASEDELKEKMKKERLDQLTRQKTRTIEEIKEVNERIDVVKLYSGKTIQGAILSRGDNYTILTTAGVVEVPKKDVRAVSVIR